MRDAAPVATVWPSGMGRQGFSVAIADRIEIQNAKLRLVRVPELVSSRWGCIPRVAIVSLRWGGGGGKRAICDYVRRGNVGGAYLMVGKKRGHNDPLVRRKSLLLAIAPHDRDLGRG